MLMLSDKMLRQASLLAARSIPAIRLTAPGVIENTIPGIHFIPILAATPLDASRSPSVGWGRLCHPFQL